MLFNKFGYVFVVLAFVFKRVAFPDYSRHGIERLPFFKLSGNNLTDLLISTSGYERAFLPFPYQTGEKGFIVSA